MNTFIQLIQKLNNQKLFNIKQILKYLDTNKLKLLLKFMLLRHQKRIYINKNELPSHIKLDMKENDIIYELKNNKNCVKLSFYTSSFIIFYQPEGKSPDSYMEIHNNYIRKPLIYRYNQEFSTDSEKTLMMIYTTFHNLSKIYKYILKNYNLISQCVYYIRSNQNLFKKKTVMMLPKDLRKLIYK